MSEDNSIVLGTERVLVDGVIKKQIYFNEGKIIDDKLVSYFKDSNIDIEEYFSKLTS